MVSTAPFDPLYKPVNNFLIAKQQIDLTMIPDFLSLFHDSEVEATERRAWILEVLRDGTKTMTDVNIIFKTMCLKMMMDFYSSIMCDKKIKERILGVLCSITAIPRAAEILIEGYGLISWLHYVVRNLKPDEKSLVKCSLVLIKHILYSYAVASFAKIIGSGRKNKSNKNVDDFGELKTNKGFESEILVMLSTLLSFASILNDEDLILYIQNGMLLKKVLNKRHLINIVNSINVNCEFNKVLLKAIVINDYSVLKSKLIVDFMDKENNVNKIIIADKLRLLVTKCLL